jgi:hypothetical protein
MRLCTDISKMIFWKQKPCNVDDPEMAKYGCFFLTNRMKKNER